MAKRRFNKAQIEALEDLLINSKDLGSFGKQFAVWLLRQSDGLTRNVCVETLPDLPEEEKKQIGHGLHDINSSCGTTHVQLILRAMGSKRRFFVCDVTQSQDDYGYLAWISYGAYNPRALKIPFDLQAIKTMPLIDSFGRRNNRRNKRS